MYIDIDNYGIMIYHFDIYIIEWYVTTSGVWYICMSDFSNLHGIPMASNGQKRVKPGTQGPSLPTYIECHLYKK